MQLYKQALSRINYGTLYFVAHLRIVCLPKACREEMQEVWETLPSKEDSKSKQ